MNKKIKCVRCHNNKIVPSDWQKKECKPCSERTERRRQKGKVPIEKIEAKAIGEFVNFESAWKRQKAFWRKLGKEPQSKEQFMKEYMQNQKPKIDAIKAIIAKYDDKRCPILSQLCLEFRRLFSMRQNYIDTEKFALELTPQETNLFYNHAERCDSCSFYVVLHKTDFPVEPKFNEEVSQEGFEKGIDDFFTATKPKIDPIEEFENRQGLRDIPVELLKHLSSEYARQDQKEEL
jgi:hypothetical protein